MAGAASALFLLDMKGRVLISRDYRGDVTAPQAERAFAKLMEGEVIVLVSPTCSFHFSWNNFNVISTVWYYDYWNSVRFRVTGQVMISSDYIVQIAFLSRHFQSQYKWCTQPQLLYNCAQYWKLSRVVVLLNNFFSCSKWTGWPRISWTSIAGKWCDLPIHSAQQCLCYDSLKTELQCC